MFSPWSLLFQSGSNWTMKGFLKLHKKTLQSTAVRGCKDLVLQQTETSFFLFSFSRCTVNRSSFETNLLLEHKEKGLKLVTTVTNKQAWKHRLHICYNKLIPPNHPVRDQFFKGGSTLCHTGNSFQTTSCFLFETSGQRVEHTWPMNFNTLYIHCFVGLVYDWAKAFFSCKFLSQYIIILVPEIEREKEFHLRNVPTILSLITTFRSSCLWSFSLSLRWHRPSTVCSLTI